MKFTEVKIVVKLNFFTEEVMFAIFCQSCESSSTLIPILKISFLKISLTKQVSY